MLQRPWALSPSPRQPLQNHQQRPTSSSAPRAFQPTKARQRGSGHSGDFLGGAGGGSDSGGSDDYARGGGGVGVNGSGGAGGGGGGRSYGSGVARMSGMGGVGGGGGAGWNGSRGESRRVFALSPSLSISSSLIFSSIILSSLSQPTPTSTRSSSADSAERRVVFPLCLPSHLFRLSSFSLPSCPLAPLIPSPFAYLVLPLVFAQPRLAPSLSFLLSSLLFFLLRGIGSS